ncbi:hypothetical protein J6590_106191, partial [Homalodisca vitripennis]
VTMVGYTLKATQSNILSRDISVSSVRWSTTSLLQNAVAHTPLATGRNGTGRLSPMVFLSNSLALLPSKLFGLQK